MEYNEEFQKYKEEILKFVLFKKRTEYEVRIKLAALTNNEDIIEELMEFLKEENYINDENYVKRYINEVKALKNISIKDLKQKLYSKGLNLNLLDNYMDELYEYEKKAAANIVLKKQNSYDTMQMREYLLKKGFGSEVVNDVLLNNE